VRPAIAPGARARDQGKVVTAREAVRLIRDGDGRTASSTSASADAIRAFVDK
jgi:hypothetical protein